jgi:hypothetical protein
LQASRNVKLLTHTIYALRGSRLDMAYRVRVWVASSNKKFSVWLPCDSVVADVKRRLRSLLGLQLPLWQMSLLSGSKALPDGRPMADCRVCEGFLLILNGWEGARYDNFYRDDVCLRNQTAVFSSRFLSQPYSRKEDVFDTVSSDPRVRAVELKSAGDVEAYFLANALQKSRHVQVVDFSGNCLTGCGLSFILDLMLQNTTVRELYLFHSRSLTPADQALLQQARDDLRRQCQQERLHSLLLWS